MNLYRDWCALLQSVETLSSSRPDSIRNFLSVPSTSFWIGFIGLLSYSVRCSSLVRMGEQNTDRDKPSSTSWEKVTLHVAPSWSLTGYNLLPRLLLDSKLNYRNKIFSKFIVILIIYSIIFQKSAEFCVYIKPRVVTPLFVLFIHRCSTTLWSGFNTGNISGNTKVAVRKQ